MSVVLDHSTLVLDSELVDDRIAAPSACNGLRLGYVTLEAADPPTFAWLDVEFQNGSGLSPLPAIADFAVEGGLRPGHQPVTVTEVHAFPGGGNALRLKLEPLGDYSTYTLTTVESAGLLLDPLSSRLPFKFRPGCFNLSCEPQPEAPRKYEQPAIDYLARDYDSFRHVLMAAMAARVPGWSPTSEADLDQVLIDLIAARGDELADAHDRVMSERALGSARKRVSLARHARLVDYHIHQGNQATTQVVVQALAQTDLPPVVTAAQWGWIVFSGRDASDAESVIFALVERPGAWRRRVFPELNDLRLYTWGDTVTALAKGATSADIVSGTNTTQASAQHLRDLFLGVDAAQAAAPADVDAGVERLVIQQMLNPATGSANGVDIHRRQLLHLLPISADPLAPKRAEALRDPVANRWFCRVRWIPDDALHENYCFILHCGGLVRDATGFFGNVVDVAHGRPRETTFRAEDAPLAPPAGTALFPRDQAHWTSELRQRGGALVAEGARAALPRDPSIGPLAYLDTPPGGERETRSTLAVRVGGFAGYWQERIDLVDSEGTQEHYVVETDEMQSSVLRFGNGSNGLPLPADADVTCRYQTGRGTAGNIGADKLEADGPAGVTARNPFDVTNGRDPETRDDIVRRAPELYRVRQHRAVTLADYAREAESVAGVSHARARYVWCGSWRGVRVVIDPAGRLDLTRELAVRVSEHLDAVRLAGDDIEIRPAAYVPLDIRMVICAHSAYWIEDVRAELQREFSDGHTADGRPGFFNPDSWTFGQSLHVGQLIGRALAVQGVERVVRISMRRLHPGGGGLVTIPVAPADLPESLVETLEIGAFEVLVVANDPDRLERGRIVFEMRGGRR
jgi:hypothetical protein